MIGFIRGANDFSSGADRNQIHADAETLYISAQQGIIPNTFQMVYDDMALINDLYPTGKPTSFKQFYSGVTGYLHTNIVEWTKCNLWFEFDMQQPNAVSCNTGELPSFPNNSCIEVGKATLYWLDDLGNPNNPNLWQWKRLFHVDSHITGGSFNYSGGNIVCETNPAFAALRAEMTVPNFDSSTIFGDDHLNLGRLPNGNLRINPVNGWRYHGWGEANGVIDKATIQAVYGCYWFRVVLIDPNGPDDRHLYNQVVHIASDMRTDANIFPSDCPQCTVGGLSRYKKVPNNGDWMPINFICFKRDDAYGDGTTQTTLQRIIDTNPPLVLEPNPTTLPSVANSLIANDIDQIVADMYDANTGWVSHMPSSYGQFQGPVLFTTFTTRDFDRFNVWLEIEAGGNGSGCSPDTNLATNTAVEIGWIRGYKRENNTWTLVQQVQNLQTPADLGGSYEIPNRWDVRRCLPTNGMVIGRDGELQQDDLYDNPDRRAVNFPYLPSIINGNTTNGFLSVSPARFHRFHGWTPNTVITKSTLQGIYGVCYVRLILKDPSGPDDRHLANYVGHIASDVRIGTTYVGDTGISRYKKITTEWTAMNFFAGMTEAEIRATPPPIITTP